MALIRYAYGALIGLIGGAFWLTGALVSRLWPPFKKTWTRIAATAIEVRAARGGDECRHDGTVTKLDIFALDLASSYGAIGVDGPAGTCSWAKRSVTTRRS